MRTGDLAELSNALFDPATTVANPNQPNAFIRQPFPNNVIPASRIDPIAQFFLKPEWIPLPIQPGIAANLRREFSIPSHYNQETVKIDQRLSAADNLSGRFSVKRAVEGSYGNYHGLNPYDPGANPKRPNGYNSVLNWTHIFSPTTLLEARASFSRAKVLFDTPNFGTTDYTAQLGIQGFGPGISDVYPSYPIMNITGFTGLPQGFLLNYTSNNFEYTANYTMVRGRHTFKMGETAWDEIAEFTSTMNKNNRSWAIPFGGGSNGRYNPGVYFWNNAEEDGQIVAGVMSAPAMGERWYARRGGGTWAVGSVGPGAGERRRVGVSRVAEIANAQILCSSPFDIEASGMAPGFPALVRSAWRDRGFGDFWGYALVAEGAAEAMVEIGPNSWDLAAPSIVVEEAGGRMTDVRGERTIHGGSALATNGVLHDEIVARLRG
jgi:histidinol-phosphatase